MEEKDNKVYFDLIYDDYEEKDNDDYDDTKKFELQIITLDEQYQQNIKPGDGDLLYFDTKKLGKSFE